jgi:hypothetical protein
VGGETKGHEFKEFASPGNEVISKDAMKLPIPILLGRREY